MLSTVEHEKGFVTSGPVLNNKCNAYTQTRKSKISSNFSTDSKNHQTVFE